MVTALASLAAKAACNTAKVCGHTCYSPNIDLTLHPWHNYGSTRPLPNTAKNPDDSSGMVFLLKLYKALQSMAHLLQHNVNGSALTFPTPETM